MTDVLKQIQSDLVVLRESVADDPSLSPTIRHSLTELIALFLRLVTAFGGASLVSDGALLRQRRVALWLSREQLARKAGVSVATIVNWECGSHRPRAETRACVLAALKALEDKAGG